MREKLKNLADLQKVDVEIHNLRKSAEIYPKQLAELEKDLGAAKSAVEAERAKLSDLERQKRTLEQTITDEKEKVKKWEQRLAEQRSTREYAALAREIDIAKKANLTSSEEVVEIAKTLALARDQVKAKEQELSARQDTVGGRVTELKDKLQALDGQVKELESKRGNVARSVDGTLLNRYETVRKKKVPALVSVVNGTCQGCNMNVPPQLYNQLRVSLGTDICPSCKRLICATEALESAKSKA